MAIQRLSRKWEARVRRFNDLTRADIEDLDTRVTTIEGTGAAGSIMYNPVINGTSGVAIVDPTAIGATLIIIVDTYTTGTLTYTADWYYIPGTTSYSSLGFGSADEYVFAHSAKISGSMKWVIMETGHVNVTALNP